MVYNSKILASLLATSIAGTTAVILFLFGGVSTGLLLAFFIVSFGTSFLMSFLVLEYSVFKEINKLKGFMEKLGKKEFQELRERKSGVHSPLEKINEEIFSFADQKQQEIEELRKLEAFRREFIANISHELKTPIFAAQGFVHTLLDGAVDDKNVRGKFLKKAAKSLDGLDVLVQDLLTLSYIETRQIRMHFEQVDLYKIAQDVFDQLEKKAAKRNIQLSIEGSMREVVVYADGQRIFQVLTNLVSNAIQHSKKEGQVVVKFEEESEFVTTHVLDFGKGIPPEDVARIFERFYRVEKSRSREKGGSGLGLAIVKHILERHNSKAEVSSTPGQGSDFNFKLPRNKPDNLEPGENT